MGGILIQQRKIVTIWFLSLFSILIAQNPIRVNGERLNAHMDELSIYGKNDFGGISRVAYSPADLSGRKYVIQLMKKAGLEVNIDPGGNIIATLKGAGFKTCIVHGTVHTNTGCPTTGTIG